MSGKHYCLCKGGQQRGAAVPQLTKSGNWLMYHDSQSNNIRGNSIDPFATLLESVLIVHANADQRHEKNAKDDESAKAYV